MGNHIVAVVFLFSFVSSIIVHCHLVWSLLLKGLTSFATLFCSGAEKASNWTHSVVSTLCYIEVGNIVYYVHQLVHQLVFVGQSAPGAPEKSPAQSQPSLSVDSVSFTGSDAAAQKDSCKTYLTLHHRFMEDRQHLGAGIKWSKLP